jgi:hypothetical protein
LQNKCNTREYRHNRQICKINADIDTCGIAQHIYRHIESIDIPFFSPFLATKYANIKPSGVYTTTVPDMLQDNFKRRNKT